MAEREPTRCPACDSFNSARATACAHCGKPVGHGATAAPSHMSAGAAGSEDRARVTGYVVAAGAVAAVLVVGGALVLFAGTDDGGAPAGSAESASIVGADAIETTAAAAEVSVTSAVTVPTHAQPPSTQTPSPATTPPATTPSATEAPATAAPATAAPSTATPSTAAPVPTAPPSTAAPTLAPQPTPPPAVTLSFDQAAEFFRGYVTTAINGDYNAAWNMLSSSDQADYPNGFDQFVGFWRSVSFADVQRIESAGGSAGFQSLLVDMAYGQVDGDPTSFEVVEVDVNIRPDGTIQVFDYRYIRNQ